MPLRDVRHGDRANHSGHGGTAYSKTENLKSFFPGPNVSVQTGPSGVAEQERPLSVAYSIAGIARHSFAAVLAQIFTMVTDLNITKSGSHRRDVFNEKTAADRLP